MKRILLIEDDPLIAMLQSRLLSDIGLVVVQVESLDRAARALESEPPDLILSDLQLATGTPQNTIQFLARVSRSVPIVICSGSFGGVIGDELAKACQAAGFMDSMNKFEVRDAERMEQRLRNSYDRFHATKDGAGG